MRVSALLIGLIFTAAISAQTSADYYQHTIDINKTGMYILGGWALTNMVVGGYGWSQKSGVDRHFHQMNLLWNTVNLTIAGIGLYSALQTDVTSLDWPGVLSEQRKTENIYLINAGLDVLYMGTGYYLTRLASKKINSHDMLKGFGYSVVMQGAFLFVFDLVMYAIQRSHALSFPSANSYLSVFPGGVSMHFSF